MDKIRVATYISRETLKKLDVIAERDCEGKRARAIREAINLYIDTVKDWPVWRMPKEEKK